MSGSHSAPIRTGSLAGWKVDAWSLSDGRYFLQADAPTDPNAPPRLVGIRHYADHDQPGFTELEAGYHGGLPELEAALRWALTHYAEQISRL